MLAGGGELYDDVQAFDQEVKRVCKVLFLRN
jgi:hypothetical protein